MLRALACAVVVGLAMAFSPALAQEEQVWIQIEAQPSLEEASDRARAYAAVFPETHGFRLRSGWYAIALGPYPSAEAAAQLAGLRRENLIPADSFIAEEGAFGDAFWPAGGVTPPLVAPEATAEAPLVEETLPEAEPAPEPAPLSDETPQEARASEALLLPEERQELQTALSWYGYYEGGIDGAFGRGTRASMEAWQTAMGQEPTGILTARQRATLVANYRADLAEFGFAEVVEAEAGIKVTLPLGLVEFDHYEPPFVHFRAKADWAPRIILISQPGDQAALYGLYDILQSLEIMPLSGERERQERSFTLTGTSATTASTAYAELNGGLIKGWIFVSTPGNADRDGRILDTLRASFEPEGDRALDPGMVPMDGTSKAGLLSGLEVRRPVLSRSGFYVDAVGHVATTTEAVQSCGRITLDRGTEAGILWQDAKLGLAVLAPKTPLAPPVFAALQSGPERVGVDVAVAGYSYEDRLPSPVLTYGRLEETQGLNGETFLKRLTLAALPGDAGGPVLDGTGAVIGLLLPNTPVAGKTLPPEVTFALSAGTLGTALTTAGLVPTPSSAAGALAPEDLSRKATGMTVLVSCWE